MVRGINLDVNVSIETSSCLDESLLHATLHLQCFDLSSAQLKLFLFQLKINLVLFRISFSDQGGFFGLVSLFGIFNSLIEHLQVFFGLLDHVLCVLVAFFLLVEGKQLLLLRFGLLVFGFINIKASL
jgi:hypothetical protein